MPEETGDIHVIYEEYKSGGNVYEIQNPVRSTTM